MDHIKTYLEYDEWVQKQHILKVKVYREHLQTFKFILNDKRNSRPRSN